jgi:hypothetical protein
VQNDCISRIGFNPSKKVPGFFQSFWRKLQWKIVVLELLFCTLQKIRDYFQSCFEEIPVERSHFYNMGSAHLSSPRQISSWLKEGLFESCLEEEISGTQKHCILLDKTSLKPVVADSWSKSFWEQFQSPKIILHLVRTSLTLQKRRWGSFDPFCEEKKIGESKDYCILDRLL